MNAIMFCIKESIFFIIVCKDRIIASNLFIISFIIMS